jgi:hypothetical protein
MIKKLSLIFFLFFSVQQNYGMGYTDKVLVYWWPSFYMNKLLEAIKLNDYNQVKRLLDTGLNPSKQQLSVALQEATDPVLKLLAEHHADINGQDPNTKNTVLLEAVDRQWYFDYIKKIELLLLHKADSNIRNSKGETPLHAAVRKGYPSTIKLLLMYGANSTLQDENNKTPLYYARNTEPKNAQLALEKMEIIKSLEENEQMFKQAQFPTKDQFTRAIEQGQYGFVKFFMAKGMVPDKEDLILAKKKCEWASFQSDNDININLHRKIGREIVKYFRLEGFFGFGKKYGPISTTGIREIFEGRMPLDIIRLIGKFVNQ